MSLLQSSQEYNATYKYGVDIITHKSVHNRWIVWELR
jgi:hypothetical protein